MTKCFNFELIKHKVEYHLEDEEHTFFQLAGKVFSETKKKSLVKEYSHYMNENL